MQPAPLHVHPLSQPSRDTPQTFLRPPSCQTSIPTRPPRSPLSLPHSQTATATQSSHQFTLPHPQTPTQKPSQALRSTDNTNQLAVTIKSPSSLRRRNSDTEDMFTLGSERGGQENQRLSTIDTGHKAHTGVRYSHYSALQY